MLMVYDGEEIPYQENETILTALLNKGKDIAYQCKSGYCGTCRVRLVKGQVKYTEEPLAYLNDKEVLPCCCQIKEDTVLESL